MERITYRARVLKDLRKSPDAPVNNLVNIETNGDSGVCGVELSVMETYVLSGPYISPENLRIYTCDYRMWVNSPNIEKIEGYDCSCKTENIPRPPPDSCVVGFNMPECSSEGIRCKSEEDKCNWVCTD